MKTNRASFILGVITIAIHLAGFAAVDWGAEKFLAHTAASAAHISVANLSAQRNVAFRQRSAI